MYTGLEICSQKGRGSLYESGIEYWYMPFYRIKYQ